MCKGELYPVIARLMSVFETDKSGREELKRCSPSPFSCYSILKIYIQLRTSVIPNYVNHGGKHLENNCSGVNKHDIKNKNDHSCNILQKLRVNNPLRIIVGQLNINSIRNKYKCGSLCSIFKQKIDILLVSQTKIDDTYSLAQMCVEGYSTP